MLCHPDLVARLRLQLLCPIRLLPKTDKETSSLPFTCLQIRHIMFTWSLTNAIVDSLNDLEQAVTAAVCAKPSKQGCAGLLQRLFGWVLPTLPMLTGRNLAVYWYNMLCHDLPKHLKQGMTGKGHPLFP